jgi:8-oxo-dGTP pyrophosphatase MutT (NUDIX family)
MAIHREGAMAVVLSADRRQVLLLRREIFFLWDLPGGGIEKNESPEAAAVRETREETGFDIEIDRLVGRYLHQSVYGWGDQLTHAYQARVIGGMPKPFSSETMGLSWKRTDDLPMGLQPLQRTMVADALIEANPPCEKRIPFPVWKLAPARVVFIMINLLKKIIRSLLNWMGY